MSFQKIKTTSFFFVSLSLCKFFSLSLCHYEEKWTLNTVTLPFVYCIACNKNFSLDVDLCIFILFYSFGFGSRERLYKIQNSWVWCRCKQIRPCLCNSQIGESSLCISLQWGWTANTVIPMFLSIFLIESNIIIFCCHWKKG